MTDATTTIEVTENKSKLPLLIGVVLAVLSAGGGYIGVSKLYSGSSMMESESEAKDTVADVTTSVAFVPLDPMVISLSGTQSHLRFTAQVEVTPGTEDAVAALMPRMIDVLNDYLRAVDSSKLSEPGALIRLRSHMLRRLQVVVGEERVRDLLIMEFVIN